MVITTTGKNKIRDLISSNIGYTIMGDDGTSALDSDIALISPIADTNNVPTQILSNKTVQTNSTILSNQGNGSVLKEFGIYFSDDVLLDRIVIPDINKNDQIQIVNIDLIRIN